MGCHKHRDSFLTFCGLGASLLFPLSPLVMMLILWCGSTHGLMSPSLPPEVPIFKYHLMGIRASTYELWRDTQSIVSRLSSSVSSSVWTGRHWFSIAASSQVSVSSLYLTGISVSCHVWIMEGSWGHRGRWF